MKNFDIENLARDGYDNGRKLLPYDECRTELRKHGVHVGYGERPHYYVYQEALYKMRNHRMVDPAKDPEPWVKFFNGEDYTIKGRKCTYDGITYKFKANGDEYTVSVLIDTSIPSDEVNGTKSHKQTPKVGDMVDSAGIQTSIVYSVEIVEQLKIISEKLSAILERMDKKGEEAL